MVVLTEDKHIRNTDLVQGRRGGSREESENF